MVHQVDFVGICHYGLPWAPHLGWVDVRVSLGTSVTQHTSSLQVYVRPSSAWCLPVSVPWVVKRKQKSQIGCKKKQPAATGIFPRREVWPSAGCCTHTYPLHLQTLNCSSQPSSSGHQQLSQSQQKAQSWGTAQNSKENTRGLWDDLETTMCSYMGDS